ncbi:hypothetical protein C8J57DRAFT_1347847 [Mycena rebaudengoi]|nr:hypothetical protein C8J57DRAFT_1347847 [Mycena rebaudengoi]
MTLPTHATSSANSWWNYERSQIAPGPRDGRHFQNPTADLRRASLPSQETPIFPQRHLLPSNHSHMELHPFPSPPFSSPRLYPDVNPEFTRYLPSSHVPRGWDGNVSLPASTSWPQIRQPTIPAFDSYSWNEMLLSTFDGSDATSSTSSPHSVSSPLFTEGLLPCPSPSPSDSSGRLSPLFSPLPLPSASLHPAQPKECSHCHATSTPLWRRDPATHLTLCNACGLYLQQRNKMRPAALIAADQQDADTDADADVAPDAPRCSHCNTHRTSVWRRSKCGARLCNACGVYVRLRGRDRPLSLRRNKIRPRCKHPKPN